MIDASSIRALTFDCYGTIVDWDRGIGSALKEVRSLAGYDLARLVGEREQEEKELLEGSFRLYREILGQSMRRAAGRQGCVPTDTEVEGFVASMGRWPLFPDSADALERLATTFRLAILSNVETAVLGESVAPLVGRGIAFSEIVTAEAIRSYKPARHHWDVAQDRLGLPREAILHVAGSLHHDIRPARGLGWNTVWIDRRGERNSADLTGLAGLDVLADLASLAEALLGESM
jgi:2-haloacid dehalogenase